MRLHFKITLPIVILLIAVITALSGVSFYFAGQLIEGNMSQLSQSKLDEVQNIIIDKSAEVSVKRQEINKEYLEKAKILAYVIKQNPGFILNNSILFDMAASLGVDEIHITDENGIIKWGTVASFYGMDFNTDESMKPFLQALTNADFELVQDPTVRSSDNVLFQYAGVARKDKPGIIQIGVAPKKLQNELKKADISSISKDSTFGANGIVIIVDKDSDLIVSHIDASIQGKKAAEFDWGNRIRENESDGFRYILDGTEYYMKYQASGENIICATIPVEEFTQGLSTLLQNTVMISAAALILCIIIIFLLLKLNIINETNKLMKLIKTIGEGDLTKTVNIKSSKEFSKLSEGINLMTNNLKEIIEKVFEMTHSLKESGERLNGSADMSSKGAAEISATINELAEGANDQADGATKGAMTAKDVLDKAEVISRSIEDTVKSTELTKDTVLEGVEIIKYQNEKMQESVISVKSLGSSINDLSKQADEIGNIIEVITSIADQTNMLALNAAIEAARAGEVGKGFAVVADEVRKLAEGSTKAARQISEIVVQIQSSVEHAKEQAGNSISVIEKQQTSVRNTEEAFNKINNVTQEAVIQVGKIAAATENIISGIQMIVEIVESQASTSQESAAGTEEITASVQEQTAAIEEVAHIANDLIDVVDKLNALMNRFTV
ncbi:MAG: methyl-accepting chemotaxis protein [Clostridiaceae bacterium]|nr:methyl-accepting chemotaxis protein [Clostridiaceae bacterium]